MIKIKNTAEEIISSTDDFAQSAKDNTDTKTTNSCQQECRPISLTKLTQLVYLFQALSFVFGISAVFGVVIHYLKRAEVKDTWLASHFTWQIRTFWFGLGMAVIGSVFVIFLVGFLILAVALVWVIYRTVKGWLLLCDGKPVVDSTAFI